MRRPQLSRRARALYRHILAMVGEHPTAEELYGEVRHSDTPMSLATVYRNLDLLVIVGLVKRVDQRTSAYSQHYHARVDEHAHARCLECGCVQDVDSDGDTFGNLREALSLPEGFLMTEVNLNVDGICAQCQQDNPIGDENTGL